jgi:hypothetical protein
MAEEKENNTSYTQFPKMDMPRGHRVHRKAIEQSLKKFFQELAVPDRLMFTAGFATQGTFAEPNVISVPCARSKISGAPGSGGENDSCPCDHHWL